MTATNSVTWPVGKAPTRPWGAAILVYLLIPDGIVTLVCAAQRFIVNPAAQKLAPPAAHFFLLNRAAGPAATWHRVVVGPLSSVFFDVVSHRDLARSVCRAHVADLAEDRSLGAPGAIVTS